jgi:hypothetical protein
MNGIGKNAQMGAEEIIREFTAAGWEHLGMAVLNTNENTGRYAHIKYARSTTMFFCLPGKAMVIRAELTEVRNRGSEAAHGNLDIHFRIGVTPETPDSQFWEAPVPDRITDGRSGPGMTWHGGSILSADSERFEDTIRWDLRKLIKFELYPNQPYYVPSREALLHMLKYLHEKCMQYARDGKMNYYAKIGGQVLPTVFTQLGGHGVVPESELANRRAFWGQLDPKKLLTAAEVLYKSE